MRLKSKRPAYVTADLSALPFADGSFDGITCGYVLEHLPDPRAGHCRAGARAAQRRPDAAAHDGGQFLRRVDQPNLVLPHLQSPRVDGLCESLGLRWKNELWFTPVHKAIRAGGICVEIEKI